MTVNVDSANKQVEKLIGIFWSIVCVCVCAVNLFPSCQLELVLRTVLMQSFQHFFLRKKQKQLNPNHRRFDSSLNEK